MIITSVDKNVEKLGPRLSVGCKFFSHFGKNSLAVLHMLNIELL